MIGGKTIGEPQLYEKVFSFSQEIPNLDFRGFIPYHKVNQYFGRASLFVNTSSIEGFPNTFIQASKNGIPIISLKVNPDNFLNLYKCGFSCNDDFNKMVEYLEKLIINQDTYSEYSQNCFDYAKKNHDIAELGKEWRNLILELNNI